MLADFPNVAHRHTNAVARASLDLLTIGKLLAGAKVDEVVRVPESVSISDS
jgi:hypothetical protein